MLPASLWLGNTNKAPDSLPKSLLSLLLLPWISSGKRRRGVLAGGRGLMPVQLEQSLRPDPLSPTCTCTHTSPIALSLPRACPFWSCHVCDQECRESPDGSHHCQAGPCVVSRGYQEGAEPGSQCREWQLFRVIDEDQGHNVSATPRHPMSASISFQPGPRGGCV